MPDVLTAKEPADLTQEEAYALFDAYGGYLDAKGISILNRLLEHMSYPEQLVGDVRAETGNRLYFAAKAELEALLARVAACAPEKAPPPLEPRRTRKDRAREAVAERREAGRQWRELVEKAKEVKA